MNKELFDQAESLQHLLVAYATGGGGDDTDYTRLRYIFISSPSLEPLLPRFVRTCRSLDQFWGLIKHEFSTYAERRKFIWDAFEPLLNHLEKGEVPSDHRVDEVISDLDSSHVQSAWAKALDRRLIDPEGAITASRTLLESVCKHILDDHDIKYTKRDDLPKLYRMTSTVLNIAPSQHTEGVFKQILGGCTAVVEGLGALRNSLSDAHGKGQRSVKPAPRHAELAVNLAGAMAAFLIATWENRKEVET